MSQLVETLKAEHANIVKILLRVNELGIETPEGRKTLMSAKVGLLAHLKREDDELYPVLREAAEDDPVIEDAIEFFNTDIGPVSEAALAFFDKYEDDTHSSEFAGDFQQLAEVLLQRIQKEESVIYKMYDQLQ